jgi:transposase
MSQERLTVRKIREILRLKWEMGLSNRVVARSCRISHSTVRDYVKRAETAGLKWPLPEELDEERLYALLFPRTEQGEKQTIPQPNWNAVHAELRKKGVTLRLLWMEYLEEHPSGYSYSQFCELYRQWSRKLNPTMRLSHKAGEKMYVDYAGQGVPIIDRETGEIRQATIFVAVLGASSYIYAEAQWNQDLPNWINGHVRSFEFLGGVPEVVVPDNLKAGVTKPCRYEPGVNLAYQEMAEHYGVAVVPARVRKPRDKAKAESGVQNVERWILARLRNQRFFSLSDLNKAIRKLLDELNSKPMAQIGRSRREMFEMLDRPALKPLPSSRYEYAIWKKARVNVDYHIEFEKHYYSVPHTLLRQDVYVRATERTVGIFFKNQRVAAHPRSKVHGRHSTLKEHMPSSHQYYHEWSAERFIRWAEKNGPHTAQLIQSVLITKEHPQQAYRACMGILKFSDKHGRERLEAVCSYALLHEIYTYRGIRNILENQLDKAGPDDGTMPPVLLPPHPNIRGKDYYH